MTPPRRWPRPVVLWLDGRKVVSVDGFVQSVALDGRRRREVWDALVPEAARIRRPLLLGLGGGTVAALLARRFGPIPIVAVDCDPRMVEVGYREFGLGALAGLRVVLADAFRFAARAAASGAARHDFICVDLYRGGALPPRALAAPFLGHLRRLLAPHGVIAFNLHRRGDPRGRLRRLERVLAVHTVVEVDHNLVAYCGR